MWSKFTLISLDNLKTFLIQTAVNPFLYLTSLLFSFLYSQSLFNAFHIENYYNEYLTLTGFLFFTANSAIVNDTSYKKINKNDSICFTHTRIKN